MVEKSWASTVDILGRDTLNERIYRRLRELVLSGDAPAGVRLDENSLAERLGVSRTPLREAIGKLVKDGLVEYRPYQGNFVKKFTIEQVRELFEVREALEGLAARLAVHRLSDARLATLTAILDEVDAALRDDDMEAYALTDRRFHQAIAEYSGNHMLIEFLERLGDQIQVARLKANRDPDVVKRTAHERPQILAALRARDGEQAARLMEQHIEGVKVALLAQLDLGA